MSDINSHHIPVTPQPTIPLLFVYATSTVTSHLIVLHNIELEMWANAQRDGHPAEYMRRPLFNAAKFG